MLKLIIEDDEGKTTVVPLIRDEISIGRKEGNTIRLTERNISRRHARLLRKNGEVFVEDLDSYNGIRVNGSKVQGQVTVGEGDRIQIGDYLLALKQDQPAAQAPSDPFDEMKTVPVEKAEAQALASHMALQAQQPAATAPVPTGTPASEAETPPTAEPQHALIEEAAKAASVETPAKMVVVSTNFAGLECLLDKAAQVIGRTDDNDVVIDHRSVSKHHAKIVREGGAYSVVDLGSSNGIFVNGEKYDRVELRPGDMVDLGHVRMRFVGVGESWVFDPAAAVQTGPDGSKSNAPLFIGVGLVLAIAAGVGILFGTGVIGGGKKADPPPANQGGAVASTDMDSPSPRVSQPPDHRVLEEAIAKRDWKTAIRRADDSLLKNPEDPDARRLRQQSIEEQKNEGHSSKFFDALQAGLWERAVFEGSQIPSDSVYHPDVSKRLQEVKDKFKQQLEAEAQKLHKDGSCIALKESQRKMQTVSPENTNITELLRSCRPKEPVLVAEMMPRPPPEHRDPPVRPMDRPAVQPMDRPRTQPMDRPPPMDAGGLSAEQLLADAQAALIANSFSRAMALALQSIRKKSNPRAWAVYGVAACRSGNRGAAKRAYKSLRGGQRNMLVTVCRGSNIDLP